MMNRPARYLLIIGTIMLLSMNCGLAQNPLILGQFTADPTARVFEGKMYVYPSHDILAKPGQGRPDWFCMEDYHVFSSENLTDWTDHGVILRQNDVNWVDPNSYSMWAPDCVSKDSKYYFYFPSSVRPRGRRIGVAIGDKPYGPFKPQAQPIEGVRGVDPSVLIDKDGQAYLYYSLNRIFVARLKDNMLELDSEPQVIGNLPQKGLIEGPFVFERNGIYYLTYPHAENETQRLEYAIGTSPMGPFEHKGVIMDESPSGCWTNHHSIVEYQGQWYLFYHDNDLSPDFDKNRSIRADYLFFNEDGTIQKVTPTLRGVGVTDARKEIQIDRYSAISALGTAIAFVNDDNTFKGWKTVLTGKYAWVQYNKVDFGAEALSSVSVKALSPTGGAIDIRLDALDGPLLAQVDMADNPDWNVVQSNLLENPTDIHDLIVLLKDTRTIEIDWLRFELSDPGSANDVNDLRGKMKPWDKGAWGTGQYRNVFLEAGYKQEDIDAKLTKAYYDLFAGPNRVYFEVGDSMAYVSDLKNHDARTEGMSYGMMVAVQLNKKEVFDRLWRWSVKYMQHQGGPREGYFAWSVNPKTGTHNFEGTASDGELYFVTDLLFASNRWGNDTGIDYYAEARRILDAMWSKDGTDGINNIINVEHKQISFVPESDRYHLTDPSYHLPAFFEIWAEYAKDGHEQFYRECADTARAFLHKVCHPETGLNPDYAEYSGESPSGRRIMHAAFRYDSWRVPMNIAMDYSWYAKDKEWQQDYCRRIQNFLFSRGIDTFEDQFNVDGTLPKWIFPAGGYRKLRHSLGLVATSAAASLMGTQEKSWKFVDAVWNAKLEPYEDGYFDPYYDGFLYLFSLMHLSGNYRIIKPEISQ